MKFVFTAVNGLQHLNIETVKSYAFLVGYRKDEKTFVVGLKTNNRKAAEKHVKMLLERDFPKNIEIFETSTL